MGQHMSRGTHRFPPMDRVVYGVPLVEALAEEIRLRDCRAVYVMASGTLARQTDVIDTVRHALGNRLMAHLDALQPQGLLQIGVTGLWLVQEAKDQHLGKSRSGDRGLTLHEARLLCQAIRFVGQQALQMLVQVFQLSPLARV